VIGAIFKAMGKAHMDVTLHHDAGVTVRIMERPRQWMSLTEQAALRKDLVAIAARAAPTSPLNYGVFTDGGFDDTVITLVTNADGAPVAFNALALMQVQTTPYPTEVLHLGLVMIDPDMRSQNLSWVLYGLTCFLVFLRRQMRPVWISNVTQVPAVAGMVDQMFSGVWPSPHATHKTIAHTQLARHIMQDHRHVFGVGATAGFDATRGVITDAYTGGSDGLKKTFQQTRQHRDDFINNYCAQTLDYARGDDLLQLGHMDMAAMRIYLTRVVPRSALMGLVVAGVIAALQRLLLPVVHWLDATKPWSILRTAPKK